MADINATLKKITPGLAASVAVAAIAWGANDLLRRYDMKFGGVMLAILLGMVFGNIVKPGPRMGSGVSLCSKPLLSLAIAMLGFELQWALLSRMGWHVLAVVIPGVIITLTASCVLGRLLGYTTRFCLLMGTGNAICGSSAIAAAAPVLESDSEEIGLSLGVVNLLGTVGMLILPILAVKLALDDTGKSYLVGGSLQAVGQVAAAGSALGDQIKSIAVSVKMVRILMLIPVMIFLSLLVRRGGAVGRGDPARPEGTSKDKGKALVPGYLWGFLGCSIAAALLGGDQSAVVANLEVVAKILLMIAMAAVGMKIHLASLLKHAPRAVALGALTMIVQLAALMGLIHLVSRR